MQAEVKIWLKMILLVGMLISVFALIIQYYGKKVPLGEDVRESRVIYNYFAQIISNQFKSEIYLECSPRRGSTRLWANGDVLESEQKILLEMVAEFNRTNGNRRVDLVFKKLK